MKRSLFLIFIIVLFFGCAGIELEDTAGPPAIPPPPLGTSSELTAGTVTSARSWAPKTLSDQFSGASAEVVNEAVSTANFDGDTSHAASQDALENYFLLGDADLDGLPDVLDTDAVDAIGEIASGLKSGSDGTVITGTAGTDTYTAVWNADGDLVDGYDPSTKANVSGDTFTGEITLDENGVEFQETDTISDCSGFAATGGGLFYDDSEGKFKKCQDNVLTDLDTGGGISDLDDLPGDTIDDDLIDSALVANFPDQSVDSGSNPVLDGENFSNLQMDSLVSVAASTQTIADSGDGTPAAGSTTPNTNGYPETLALTCSDSDGCAVTMGETSVNDGQTYKIINMSANDATMADSAGVQELTSPVTLAQYESITLEYRSDRWVELSRATNALSFSSLDSAIVIPDSFCVAISDETTDLTTGNAKRTFRMPYAMTLDSDGLRASVNTAPTGSTIIIDINEGGSTIMTTNKLSIDASEETSTTAATAAGITDTALADDAEITIDIDQIGSSTAGKGAKVCFRGTRSW